MNGEQTQGDDSRNVKSKTSEKIDLVNRVCHFSPTPGGAVSGSYLQIDFDMVFFGKYSFVKKTTA